MEELSSRLSTLFSELKRRRVFRVAAVYAAVAFVIWQVAAILIPALLLPAWTLTLVVVLVLLGFPLALVLAWAFEITPEGVVLTTALDSGMSTAGAGERPATGAPPAPARLRPWPRRAALSLSLALVVGGGGYLAFGSRFFAPRDELPEIRSLAVLPLANLSADPEQEYFTDGMTEALIGELGKIGALKVISRTSAMQFKGVRKPLPQIARELGVEGLIEGSVLRAGDQVRITVQLLHGPTDRHLWAESYEGDLCAVLALQREIARAVAREIRVAVSPAERSRLAGASGAAAYRSDPEAYEA